jgi:hypothetical protein
VTRLAALLLVALAGCASTPPPPGTQVAEERLAQSVVPGQTTKAELLASFGQTRSIRFDSGYEVWLYQSPADGGRFTEFVILVDPAGVVSKTRRRAPTLP